MMAVRKVIKVDAEKIRLAIQTGIPLTILTYTLPIEMEDYIMNVLRSFLSQLGQQHMIDSLVYSIKELTNNAKKANTKRVYFTLKKLDINNPDDYKKGMEHFKMDTIPNIKYYLEEQRKYGYYIKVLFQIRNNKIKIEVKNHADLLPFEYMRIHDKITRAQLYKSVQQGLMELLDDSEGAGLGIVIMSLMLRKIGLSEDNFQVLCENGETISRIIIPLSEHDQTAIHALSKEFVELIDTLPEFPENITNINRLINDPKSRMSDIATQISNDVSLTAELLKLVNSAAYFLSAPVQSIGESVKIVGLRGISNLLCSLGSMETLIADESTNRRLWDHSYKVAFYSYNLSRNFLRTDRNSIEDSYVCGLLHDMGKILFENLKPNSLEKISKVAKKMCISKEFFETVIAGMNHGEIAALLAEKWNFPKTLCQVIRYHHTPLDAPEEYKKLAAIVYIADMISHYEDKEVEFDQIDLDVLGIFKIETEEQFEGITKRLSSAFIR